jgi:hypothetical protein
LIFDTAYSYYAQVLFLVFIYSKIKISFFSVYAFRMDGIGVGEKNTSMVCSFNVDEVLRDVIHAGRFDSSIANFNGLKIAPLP